MKLMACALVLAISSMVFAEDTTDAEVRELGETIVRQKQEIEKLKARITALERKLAERYEKNGNKPGAEGNALKGKSEDVVYLGKKRTKEWFEKMYTQFHDKIALVDRKYYDIGERKLRLEALVIQNKKRIHPFKPFGSGGKPPREVAIYEHIGGVRFNNPKVLQILGPKELLASGYKNYHITGVSTENVVTGDYFFAWVVYVGTYQYVTAAGSTNTVASYRAYTPLTRDQFREALSKGIKLMKYSFKQVTPNKRDPSWHYGVIAWHEKQRGKERLVYNKVISRQVP